MSVLLGSIKKAYNVFFYHKRNDEIEEEIVIANSEKEAIELATKKHRKSYPKQHFVYFKIK